MSPAEITIVVPAFNVARYIGAALASLQAQTLADWRCVVVDDGSVDDTSARVSSISDPRIRLMRQSNAGVSAARNGGLSTVETPFVMFLDGDDLLHPEALKRLRAGFDKRPDAVATFGALRKLLADGRPYPGEKALSAVSYPSGDVLEAMVRENFLANGGHVLIRTAAARTAGGFNPTLKLSEDWDFWCRLAMTGPFEFIGAPPEVFSLRMSPGSASGGLAGRWENHRAAVETVLGNPALSQRFTAPKWRRLQRQVWASHRWEAGRVNFTRREFGVARRLMIHALATDFRPKRAVLFALAQVSQATNRSLVSRLRFVRDDDFSDVSAPGTPP